MSLNDMLESAAIVPASELLSKIIEEIFETVRAAREVLIEKESFAELSSYLERIVPVLRELIKKNIQGSESLNNVTQILSKAIKLAKAQILDCSKRNKVYLLVNCRKIVKGLQDTTKEITRALSIIPLASLDLSSSIIEDVNTLCDDMLKVEFKAAVAEERALERIESGIQERKGDRSYANDLLVLIAKAVGTPTNRSALKKEFEEFKKEIEDARLRKDQAEAIQMDQIIALLGRADAVSSIEEKEKKYYIKRNSLGNQPLEPLQSFYCPITRDVMIDPVETSSGQTFERSAIQKWLADGNTTCPLTKIPLNGEILRPNITLQKSIEEWKDRNTMITIGSMKAKLCSSDEQEVLSCLGQLQDLCVERDLHREWVALENYIPVLVRFLSGSNSQMRSGALVILRLLAMDNDDNKERIAEVENAIESIVKSLARRIGEGKLAVALLLELSKNNMVCDRIGKVQGCILLLVTILNSENTQAARDAKELLEILSFDDQNVVQMAKVNYFKPLLQRISSGSDISKMIMATALADMELTDHNKAALFDDGVLKPLLQLVSHGNAEVKQVAVKALQNLSSLPQNGLQMIREAALPPLLDLLYLHQASSPILREQVAATIMNLAISATLPGAGETPLAFLESDDDIFRLFSLVSLTGPGVQQSILRAFHAICQPPSAIDMRAKLRQCGSVQILVPLCEQNPTIRASAVKLFFCLTMDGNDDTLADHVDQRCLGTLLMIVKTSDDEEEKTAAMGIISNLPKDHTQITQWLLDAGALGIIVRFLTDGMHNGGSMNHLLENASGALCRFTLSTNTEWQKRAAEAGIIPVLVQLLASGTALAKKHAAISLAQFSDSSFKLSRPLEKRRGFLCCSTPPEPGCPVHLGMCSMEESFCLVEANAVEPLVRVLGDADFGASEAALMALSTLIDGERLQDGSKVLSEVGGIAAIIKLLSNPSIDLQEKALHILERVFRLPEYKQKYGASAQMPLVDITQRGTGTMKPLAARILAHLNVLYEQSSFF